MNTNEPYHGNAIGNKESLHIESSVIRSVSELWGEKKEAKEYRVMENHKMPRGKCCKIRAIALGNLYMRARSAHSSQCNSLNLLCIRFESLPSAMICSDFSSDFSFYFLFFCLHLFKLLSILSVHLFSSRKFSTG